MSSEKLAQVVDTLIVNTKNGNIAWKESPLKSNVFEYSTTHSTITVAQEAREVGYNTSSDVTVIRIFNEQGVEAESIWYADIEMFESNAEEILSDFFRVVRRQALELDKALDSILADLPKVPDGSSVLLKNRVPF